MLVHENVESPEAFDFLAQRLLNQIFGVQQHVLVIFREILPNQHLLFTPVYTIGIQDCIPLERRRAWGRGVGRGRARRGQPIRFISGVPRLLLEWLRKMRVRWL